MKNISLAYLAVAAFLSAPVGLIAIGGGTEIDVEANIQVGVNNCTGGHSVCPITQTLGAFGQPFSTDPMQASINDLGKIDQQMNVTLNIPQKVDGYTMYSVTPTEGELSGKTIYLALRLSAKGKPGSRLAGLYPVELFRLVAGQDAKRGWARAAEFVMTGTQGMRSSQQTQGTLRSLSFTFLPNGNASTIDPKGKRVDLILGTQQLK